MALLQLPPNSEQAILLTTPNRNEILRDGPPTHAKYKILGRGAFGTVFKAIYHGQPVAVKIVRNECKANAQSLRSEMQVLGWKHRNIVRILKIETTTNFGIIIMERLVGWSLQEILDATQLPLEHRIFITVDILSALTHCHKRNLLHLDVKPQNVLVCSTGIQPNLRDQSISIHFARRQYISKLCDFGASLEINTLKSTAKGNARGTMRYMSPEALREEPLTTAADIFSLGITMWQMRQRCTPYHWIACNEVVAYQVVKNKLRPDSTTHRTATTPTSIILTEPNSCKSAESLSPTPSPLPSPLHHKCHCANLAAEEITYHSLVHLTNVLNRTKKPEEQLRLSNAGDGGGGCGDVNELQQQQTVECRRPFASLRAKMNVMRNLSGELKSMSKSPQAVAMQRSPMQKQITVIGQRSPIPKQITVFGQRSPIPKQITVIGQRSPMLQKQTVIEQRSPMHKQEMVTNQPQQCAKSELDLNFLALFEDHLHLHDRTKEDNYKRLCRDCWSHEPSLRPSAVKLRKRLVELL